MSKTKRKNAVYNLESEMFESIQVLMTFVTRMDYSEDVTFNDLKDMNKTEKCAYDVLIENFNNEGALHKLNEIVDNYIRMRSGINLDIVINHVFARENIDPITEEEYNGFSDYIKQAVNIVVESSDYKTPLEAVNNILDKMLDRQQGGAKTTKGRTKAQIASDILSGFMGKEKTGKSGNQTTANLVGHLFAPLAQAAQKGIVDITTAGTNKLSSKISGTTGQPIITTTVSQPITLSPAFIREEINRVATNGTMTASQKTIILSQLQTILGQIQTEVDRLNNIPTVGGKKKKFDVDSLSNIFTKWNEN